MKKQPDIEWALCASVIEMLQRGLSFQAVADATGLSIGQVSYRAQAFDTHPSDYRKGKTAQAMAVIERTPCAKYNLTATRGQKYRVTTFMQEEPRGRTA